MTPNLFATQYDAAYVVAFRLYWSRANMPSADRLGNGIGEWTKTRHIRPDNSIFLCCVELYLLKIEGTKRVRQSGRDSKVEYTIKPHFRKWLHDRTWGDFLEAATASQSLPTAPEQPVQRRSFKASDFPEPLTRPTRTAAQIIAGIRPNNA